MLHTSECVLLDDDIDVPDGDDQLVHRVDESFEPEDALLVTHQLELPDALLDEVYDEVMRLLQGRTHHVDLGNWVVLKKIIKPRKNVLEKIQDLLTHAIEIEAD